MADRRPGLLGSDAKGRLKTLQIRSKFLSRILTSALAASVVLMVLAILGAPPSAAQRVINGCPVAPHSQCLNANLTGAILREAELFRANLQGAILRQSDLRGANLEAANLIQADLFHANLSGANLRGALLVGAQLRWANLTEANFSGAIWSNGHKCALGSIGACN
jgi:hypothetical protein